MTLDRRSRLALAAFGLTALALAAGVTWRRRPAPPVPSTAPTGIRPVPEVEMVARAGRPVVFVGLDGADWELLDLYARAGAMPNLAALTREGSGGVLESLHPPLSPLVWTTMMTGLSPHEHGILDFTRFNPRSGDKEPITSDERREPAVWNMATYAGKRVAVLGLWATYPAEPVNGLMVSDRLFSFLYHEEAPPPGVVYPGAQEAWAREVLRRAEQEVGYSTLKAYLPWLDEVEYRRRLETKDPYAHPVSALRRILVETRVYDELAREWAAREKPDLTVVYLQGTDSVGHVFAPYAPPRQPSTSEEDFRRYRQVPELYFKHVDRLLGEYRALAEAAGGTLVVTSDHGFTWGEGRPTQLSSFATATAAKWHRNDGIYLLWGPGIAAAPGHPHRAKVIQVCATLLALLGLPEGVHVAGPALPGTPAGPTGRVDYRAYYTPSSLALATDTSGADQEALAKLKALGYIGTGEAATAPEASRGSTRTAGSYNNEGLVLKNAGRPDEAIQAFEKALTLDPDLASALWNLSDLLFDRDRDPDRSDALLVRAFANRLPEGTRYLMGRAIGYQRAGKLERSLALMRAAAAARPDEPEVWLFSGRYLIEAGDCRGASADFQKAVRLAPGNAATHAALGLARLCLGDRTGARQSFGRSLELDPSQPQVRDYLHKL